eukprot:331520-Prymnesium_polylepis.1
MLPKPLSPHTLAKQTQSANCTEHRMASAHAGAPRATAVEKGPAWNTRGPIQVLPTAQVPASISYQASTSCKNPRDVVQP